MDPTAQPPIQPTQPTFQTPPSPPPPPPRHPPLDWHLIGMLGGAFIVILTLFIGGTYVFGIKHYDNIGSIPYELTPLNKPNSTKTKPKTATSSAAPNNPVGNQITIDTSNWKIYTNNKVGFRIKYPPRYSNPALPSGSGSSPTLYANGTEDKTEIIFGQTSEDSYYLTVFPFSGTLDDLFNLSKNNLFYKPDSVIPVIFPNQPQKLIKSLAVDGQKTNWYTNGTANGSASSTNEIHVIANNHAFILRTTDVGKVNTEELNGMLSTFKFTQ